MAKLMTDLFMLDKIDKEKIIILKSGRKAYPISAWLNEKEDDHGNILSIVEPRTKDEIENKKRTVYLGNMKFFNKEKPSNTKDVSDIEKLPWE